MADGEDLHHAVFFKLAASIERNQYKQAHIGPTFPQFENLHVE
jgi:hypothetical protein